MHTMFTSDHIQEAQRLHAQTAVWSPPPSRGARPAEHNVRAAVQAMMRAPDGKPILARLSQTLPEIMRSLGEQLGDCSGHTRCVKDVVKAERNALFTRLDGNGNGLLSLAELRSPSARTFWTSSASFGASSSSSPGAAPATS